MPHCHSLWSICYFKAERKTWFSVKSLVTETVPTSTSWEKCSAWMTKANTDNLIFSLWCMQRPKFEVQMADELTVAEPLNGQTPATSRDRQDTEFHESDEPKVVRQWRSWANHHARRLFSFFFLLRLDTELIGLVNKNCFGWQRVFVIVVACNNNILHTYLYWIKYTW